MKLEKLLQDVPVLEVHADLQTEITGIACDSRRAAPGCLFTAISGFASDGNRFIPMAMEKGAAVVVTARAPEQPVPYVLVSSDRLALALISANFYGHPARDMTVIEIGRAHV